MKVNAYKKAFIISVILGLLFISVGISNAYDDYNIIQDPVYFQEAVLPIFLLVLIMFLNFTLYNKAKNNQEITRGYQTTVIVFNFISVCNSISAIILLKNMPLKKVSNSFTQNANASDKVEGKPLKDFGRDVFKQPALEPVTDVDRYLELRKLINNIYGY